MAYDAISDVVITETKILVCTDSFAGSELVRKNFAAHTVDKSNGIIFISNEDGQALDPSVWIPIVSLNKAGLAKGATRRGG